MNSLYRTDKRTLRWLTGIDRGSAIKARITKKLKSWLHGVASGLSVASFLLLWEMVSRSGLFNPYLFPPPSEIAKALIGMASSGQLLVDLQASTHRILLGYLTGSAAGVAIGLITGRYRLMQSLITPIIQMVRPIPPISFVPVAILWFGLGDFSKYFLVFWGVFFPVWYNTHFGVRSVDSVYVRAAQSLGANQRQLMFEVILPGAMRFILAGLGTAVPIAFYCLVAAEIAGAYSGVAYRIDVAHLNFQVSVMFAGLIVLGIMSTIADRAFGALTKKLFPWAR